MYKKDAALKEEMVKYFDLPEAGKEPRPVFYIEDKGKKYFGYTPNLRLFYDHSIHDGLRQNDNQSDMVREMFGYADKDASFKSRVSFSEAIVWDESVRETGPKAYILGGPKASSYLDYLKQNENKDTATYNDDDSELRGVKQYWLREKAVTMEAVIKDSNDNEKVLSKFTAVPQGAVFEGTVRFHNLTKEELGLLIFSLELHRGESRQNIGKAKAFGYGAFEASIEKIERYDAEKAYSFDEFALNPYSDVTAEKNDITNSFKSMILNWYNQRFNKSFKNIEQAPNIRDLFTMKSVIIPDDDIRYMKLDEYSSNGRKPLPTVNEYKKRSLNN